MKTTTFTSTISPQLHDWLAEHAKSTKQTKRAILETALRQYQIEQTQANMRKDFALITASADPTEFAEWGMEDYAHIVSS